MDKIQATLVLEILGKPAEHIKTALAGLVDKLGEEKGVKILDKKVHEPTQVKESTELFTTFAEVSAEFDELANCFGILFAYMPSHIEITSPANLSLSNIDFNDLCNKLLVRLHDYDAITKKFIYERNFLLTKLREKAPELFKKPGPEIKQAEPVEEEEKNRSEKKKSSQKAKK